MCSASKLVLVFSIANSYSENIFLDTMQISSAWPAHQTIEHFPLGGMDMIVYVWILSDPESRVKIQDPYQLHCVSSLTWLDKHTLVTIFHIFVKKVKNHLLRNSCLWTD